MRKVTRQVCTAFLAGKKMTVGNTHTDGNTLWLHGNAIARKVSDGFEISNGGWSSNTTKERLNGLPGVSIKQLDWVWYLNGETRWAGGWTLIEYMGYWTTACMFDHDHGDGKDCVFHN